MNVLHLIDTVGPGGAETVYAELAAGLARRGHTSIPVVHGPGWVDDALRAHALQPVMIPVGRTPDLRFLARLDRIVRERHVDVVQTHLLASGAYAALAGRIRGVPVVCTFHGVSDLGAPGLGRSARLSAIRWGAARAVFVSDVLRRTLAAEVRMPEGKTAVVHNGVDSEHFRPRRDGTFRRELGIADDELLVGAVGNVRAPKDYPTFLRAAALLASRSTRWRFVIVGDDALDAALVARLRQLQRELGLADRLTFAGFRSDVAAAINGMDVFVCSSRSEGFSLTICQAMACAVPVVSTRCGGPEEILSDGETGAFTDVGAPAQIADVVQRLANDAQLRERMVRAARESVASRFSLESMVGRYERLYGSIAGSQL
jgi:glycosyltransferase involved in cell wall biosynthesis